MILEFSDLRLPDSIFVNVIPLAEEFPDVTPDLLKPCAWRNKLRMASHD